MGGAGALSTALSGLTAAQASLNVISDNLANVNTPGFTRKELPLGTTALLGRGAGVLPENIVRSVDLALQRDLLEQTSISQNLQTKQRYFDQIQTFYSDPSLQRDFASKLVGLSDAFINLENSPEDIFALEDTLEAARSFAQGLNETSAFITKLRNDTQFAIGESVKRANIYLEQIADLNVEIIATQAQSQSTAALQDSRDLLVSKLSEEIGLSSFSTDEGVLSLQTQTGIQLGDTRSEGVFFDPSPISSLNFYPDSASPVLVGSADPIRGLDITTSEIGGRMGALIELRDEILPKYSAQLDELAIRTAERFQAQGLELFTNNTGTIPDPTPGSPPAYVGFADNIRVNAAVEADPTLIRSGTVPGLSVGEGSNEIIRRINEFTFGFNQENTVNGTITPGTVVGLDLGFSNIFNARGSVDLVVDSGAPITLDSFANITPGLNDSFEISVDNGVNFNTFTIGAGDTAQDLVDQINLTYPNLAALNTSGQLVLGNNTGLIVNDINLAAAGLADLGLDGFVGRGPIPAVNLNDNLAATTVFSGIGTVDIIGLGTLDTAGNINPVPGAGGNDTFEISVNGGGSFTQFEIGAGDTAQDLVDQINGTFPGLATLTPEGFIFFQNTQGILIQDVNLGAGAADLGIAGLIGTPFSGIQQNTNVGLTTLYTGRGTTNVESLTALDDLVAIEPGFDTFQISVDGGAFQQFQIQPGETAQQLVDRVNGFFPGLMSLNPLGQFVFENNVGFEIQSVNLSASGLEALGIDQFTDTGPISASNPSFDLQFGNNTPVTINILPTDAPVDIVNRINASVPDVTATYDNTTGEFLIDPNNGGDLSLIDGFGSPLQILNFTTSNIGHTAFQNAGLGPNGAVSSDIISTNLNLLDFANSIINSQSAEASVNQASADTEEAFRSTLQNTFLDQSGVNVDEELSKLISVQTAYSASARVVSTIEEFFDALLAAF